MDEYIDLYCERLGPQLLSEPINLFSNISFIIAAAIHMRWYLVMDVKHKFHKNLYFYLISLVFLIGIGSSLFHSFATRWAMLADVIPIGLFLISFLPIYIWVCHDLQAKYIWALLSYFILMTAIGSVVPKEMVNGSQNYFGSLLTLYTMGLISKKRHHEGFHNLLMASVFLSFSLIFRSLDQEMCSLIPIGTHFLWHLSNGIVLYLCLNFIKLQIKTGQARPIR